MIFADVAIGILHNPHDFPVLPPDQFLLRVLIIAFPYGFGARYFQEYADKYGCSLIGAEKKGRLEAILERLGYFFTLVFMSFLFTPFASAILPPLVDYYHSLNLPLIVRVPLSFFGKLAWVAFSGWSMWVFGFFPFMDACIDANEYWKIAVLFLTPIIIMYAGASASDVFEDWQVKRKVRGRRKRRQGIQRGPTTAEEWERKSWEDTVAPQTPKIGGYGGETQQTTVSQVMTAESELRSLEVEKRIPPVGAFQFFTADDGAVAREVANRRGLIALFYGKAKWDPSGRKYEFFAIPEELARRLLNGGFISTDEKRALAYWIQSGKIAISSERKAVFAKITDGGLKHDVKMQLADIERLRAEEYAKIFGRKPDYVG